MTDNMKKIKTPVIDAHFHASFFDAVVTNEEELIRTRDVTGNYKMGTQNVRELRILFRAAGIDKAVLLPLDLTMSKGVSLGTNEQVCAMVEKDPDIFYGFCSVDPGREDALDVLDEYFAKPGVVGLKLHPVLQEFYADDEKMDPIYDLCQRRNKPILFGAGMCTYPGSDDRYGQPVRYGRVARDFPELRICLAHMGWPWVNEVCMLMLKYRNVYADLSLLYFDNPKETYARLFGTEMGPYWHERAFRYQLMFATDEPRMEIARMKKALDDMDMREKTRENIMGMNALRFMGLEELSDDDI